MVTTTADPVTRLRIESHSSIDGPSPNIRIVFANCCEIPHSAISLVDNSKTRYVEFREPVPPSKLEVVPRHNQSVEHHILSKLQVSAWEDATKHCRYCLVVSAPSNIATILKQEFEASISLDTVFPRWSEISSKPSIVRERETDAHPAIQEFALGLDGLLPGRSVVEMAGRIVQAALDLTVDPEITVDIDGALSFDLRLADGWLLLAELTLDGTLDASVYDDRSGERIKRLPRATEKQLIGLF